MKSFLTKLNHVSTFSGEGQYETYTICGIWSSRISEKNCLIKNVTERMIRKVLLTHNLSGGGGAGYKTTWQLREKK